MTPSPTRSLRHSEHLVALPMRTFKQDCGKPSALSLAQAPTNMVLKDGFWLVGCVKDYMLEHADKVGKPFSYALGNASNVSIVRYDLVVPKEDQDAVTQLSCFNFCRTIPEMLFFGISAGRQCYCAPFYKPVAGDDSMCDAVCEGDQSLNCGGTTKSSIYEMHMCSGTAQELSETSTKMLEQKATLTTLATSVAEAGTSMQAVADTLLESLSQVGDMEASDLMQRAQVFAGELQHAANVAALEDKMTELSDSALGLGTDFSDFATTQEAEQITNDMEEVTTQAVATTESLEELSAVAVPAEVNGSSTTYYSVMYFVDKTLESVPSTCGGHMISKPQVGSLDACSSACNALVGATNGCVGFSYFDEKPGLCFLFSKLSSTMYYTGCGNTTRSGTKCMARFAEFEGTSLKPDPSGN